MFCTQRLTLQNLNRWMKCWVRAWQMKTLATTHLRQTTMVKVLSPAWEWLLGPQCVTSARAATTAYILREIRVCCCNKVMWGSTLVISNLRERWRHLVTTPGGQKKFWINNILDRGKREQCIKRMQRKAYYLSLRPSQQGPPASSRTIHREAEILCALHKNVIFSRHYGYHYAKSYEENLW